MTGEIFLKAFKINELFGSLNHDVTLKGGVTFIHGPNGCGKTTTLVIIENILKNKIYDIANIEFSSAELAFSDDTTLLVQRSVRSKPAPKVNLPLTSSADTNVEQEHVDIRATLKKGQVVVGKRTSILNVESLEEVRTRLIQRPALVERSFPFLTRTGIRNWKNINTGEVFTLAEVIDEYGERLAMTLPEWYLQLTEKVQIGVVRTQRLFDFGAQGESQNRTAVKELANILSDDIKGKINSKLTESAIQFQRKEKTFPHRILEGSVKADSEAALRKAYIALQERIAQLEAVGLQETSDSLILPRIKFNPTHRRVLTLYLADVNQKLDVFNELYLKIQLLTELLTKKFRRKTFSINRNDGFLIKPKDGADAGLKPSELSSGEKHQLVMLYELIFSDAANQLYLIDEPEISLHVEWQRQFLDDLEKIAEKRGHRFLIATHSPQIINGRRDLAVGLDGGLTE